LVTTFTKSVSPSNALNSPGTDLQININ